MADQPVRNFAILEGPATTTEIPVRTWHLGHAEKLIADLVRSGVVMPTRLHFETRPRGRATVLRRSPSYFIGKSGHICAVAANRPTSPAAIKEDLKQFLGLAAKPTEPSSSFEPQPCEL